MFALLDPPRAEVSDAVFKARRAHIRICMVTGDHPSTAAAIAKQVNILSKEISIDHGIDTFQFERDNINGQVVAHLMRNDHTLLQSHLLTDLATDIQTKTIHPNPKSSNLFQRIWTRMKFYFADPHQSKDVKRLELIPYGIVVAGADMHLIDVSIFQRKSLKKICYCHIGIFVELGFIS